MEIDKLLEELYSYSLHGIKLGLENIQKICDSLGNPEREYKTIHITGTNGKGSTATITEKILEEAGYKVGKYTSPHILKFNERIRVGAEDIEDRDISRLYGIIKDKVSELNIKPTFFEITTAMMFLYFKEQKIDYAVIEVGMGGNYDATNVVASDIAIITNVSLDHTEYLGKSIYEIAREKAGIIKKDSKVIVADKNEEFIKAIEEKTKNYTNVLEKYKNINYKLNFEKFLTEIKIDDEEYELSLFGDYQVNNFLCAYEGVKTLGISDSVIGKAIKKVIWQCRFEIYSKEPVTILEGAHNISGVENLVKIIEKGYSKDEVVIIASILKDKDINGMLKELNKISDKIILTSLKENPRGLLGDELIEKVENKKDFLVENNMQKAYEKGKKSERKIIIVCGSFYTCEKFKREVIEG